MNVLAGPGAPTIEELKGAGVRRVSLGSGPSRAALGLLREIATELKSKGTYESVGPLHGSGERSERDVLRPQEISRSKIVKKRRRSLPWSVRFLAACFYSFCSCASALRPAKFPANKISTPLPYAL